MIIMMMKMRIDDYHVDEDNNDDHDNIDESDNSSDKYCIVRN